MGISIGSLWAKVRGIFEMLHQDTLKEPEDSSIAWEDGEEHDEPGQDIAMTPEAKELADIKLQLE